MKRLVGLLSFVVAACASLRADAKADCVTVPTKAPHNLEAKVWFHVPKGYDEKRRKPYPVLVYFGGRNCSGEEEASGKLGWSDWADERGVFLLAPGFRDDEYWEPEKWSGRALFDALAEIKRKYKVDDSRISYYGYSAGSQAANLFAAWHPSRTLAWASHACGVFHEPKASMRGVPGLVTCGDADSARYVISRSFVEKARKCGNDIIWKSFPNHPHDVPPGSLRLAREFLAFAIEGRRPAAKEMFVGDDQDSIYYPFASAEADFVNPADRVLLPTRAIAQAWGAPGMKDPPKGNPDEIVRLRSGGVEFVARIPAKYDAASRIVVLFGGRGWSGEKTLSAFGFGRMADMERAFLFSPSFSKGEYWRPETGTGTKLAAAVAELRKRYGLNPSPLVLFGYSAGGQCAALFAQSKELDVAAWGVHGCGVFPEGSYSVSASALVTCGDGDADRMRIGRSFACKYRERGGTLLLKPLRCGHDLDAKALAVASEWIRAVLCGGESWIWGEDDTFKIADKDSIDPEFRNPLYTRRLADFWRE